MNDLFKNEFFKEARIDEIMRIYLNFWGRIGLIQQDEKRKEENVICK